jgi:hypothetical protein
MDAIDLLNDLAQTGLADVDTSFPNLAPAQYQFQITEASIKDNNAGTGKYMLFQCKLLSPDAISTTGDPIAPGYPVRHMINLSPSQKQIDKSGLEACVKNIKRDIAKFLEAVMGPKRTFDPTMEIYPGQTFFAKTRVTAERTDAATGVTYDPATEFATFIPKTEEFDAAAVADEFREDVPF